MTKLNEDVLKLNKNWQIIGESGLTFQLKEMMRITFNLLKLRLRYHE